MTATRYDDVAYPSVVFPQTNPERLAAISRIYGLEPADVATARVLEIGGSDGVSGMAFAATFPGSQFHNFDLSANAVARGQALVDAGGFTNVVHEVLDIMDGRTRFAAGSFDYVVAHGIYAWVPDFVREEVMKLVGHILSDKGIAFISFNATPGGHMRRITRDMLQYMLRGIDDPQDKLAAMRECLTDFGDPQPDDSPLLAGVRMHARAILSGNQHVVFHDELGPEFNPQQLSDAVDAAEAAGLSFLTDGGRNLIGHGFLPSDHQGEWSGPDADARVVRNAQVDDFATMRFFRQPLFVRQGRAPTRTLDPANLRSLYLSTALALKEGIEFSDGRHQVEIADARLAAAITAAGAAAPRRIAIDDQSLDDGQLGALFELFVKGFVNLWPGPDPFVAAPGDRPTVSPLIRAQLALGGTDVNTLDRSELRLEQPQMQRLFIAADGTRTVAELAALPDLGPLTGDVPAVFAEAARRALLVG